MSARKFLFDNSSIYHSARTKQTKQPTNKPIEREKIKQSNKEKKNIYAFRTHQKRKNFFIFIATTDSKYHVKLELKVHKNHNKMWSKIYKHGKQMNKTKSRQ